ncbi:MAG: AAA family ATPase [Planctomycetota bacterium]|jgi:dephospho-CoA kinase
MKENTIFAIVGMPGAGKSELASLFAAQGIPVIRFGDVTEEVLRSRGIPQTPKSEREIREELRAREGMAAYALRNIPKLDEALAKGHVAIDGLYSWPEYLALRETYGDRFRVLAIVASPRIRYRRLADRPVRPHTPEIAWNRDVAEIEGIQKAGPIAMADFTLVNEGSLVHLKEAFDSLWKRLSALGEG